MTGSKYINIICVIVTAIAVLFTVLFMNGSSLGIEAIDSVSFDYENTLFDDSYVHTIDIEIDDWDSFLETATSEEYSAADVTIDGEKVKNVGIRGKGNTSLSTVSQLDSDRYSFKIEFDSYEASGNYHGLDKLCLNNLIQDYTMMKDYLAYKLMGEFGAAAPLVSFSYITVNGEDWGLYLAVEAVEDSFLERNYGTNFGELYKPDSMSMGGGRGNGGGFDMRDMDFDQMGMKNPFERNASKSNEDTSDSDEDTSDSSGEEKPDFSGFAGGGGSDFPGFPDGDRSDFSGFPGGGSDSSGFPGGGPDSSGFPGGGPDSSGFPGGGAPFGMGSSDVKLQYSDDEIDSYSTIFDSAKTPLQTSDKKRLIRALKSLSEGIENQDTEAIESAVNIEEVMRYMVVHNFLVNNDSYTGAMIHNYYLYEEDGLMSMIPWDYNLAYGTFQSDNAEGAVNDPIDTPLSVTEGSSDRPMFSWITSSDEYLEMYHEYYQDFLDQFYTNGYLTELIDSTHDMIRDYVEKDPTKFCTEEEFEKAVETIRSFVTLRCESIQGQLDGTIPSTDSGQKADSSNLVSTSGISLSDMGSMGGGGGGHDRGDKNSDKSGGPGSDRSSSDKSHGPGGNPFESGDSSFGGFPGGGPGDMFGSVQTVNTTDYIYLGVSAGAIVAAILFAALFKRRRIRS